MAASTRDVYLLLRAKDEASRVVRGFSGNLLRAAAQVQAQALRAEAMNQRAEAQRLRTTGATQAQIASVLAHAQALEDEAREVERSSIATRRRIQQLDAVGASLLAIGTAMTMVGVASLRFFYNAAQDYAAYQKQVKFTLTQVDGFGASLEQLSDIGLRVGRNIAVPFEEIQPALFDIFSSTNANLAQSELLLTSFSKAAVAGNTSIQNASRGTIAIMNAYNIPLEKVNDVLDIQFELVRKGVGTYEEFATKLGNAIPSAVRAQQSFAMLAAMMAFLTRNGLSAAMASTSAARAMEAMSHPKSVKSMETLGIKVRDANGNFLPLNESLKSLRDYLLKFPSSDRVGELVEIFKGAGGTIQARRFLEQVLLRKGELEEFEGYLKSMGTATGEFEKAYGNMADGAASKTQLLTNKWTAFKLRVGETVSPVLLRIIDLLSRLLDWFDRLSPKTQRFLIYFALLGTVATVVVGVLLLFLGAVALVVGAFVAAGTEILIVLGVLILLSAGVVALGGALVTAYNKSKGFRDMFKVVGGHVSDLRTKIGSFADKVKEKFDATLGPALDRLWKTIDEKIIPKFNEFMDGAGGEVVDKVVEGLKILASIAGWAFTHIANLIDNKIIPALNDLSKWWEENKETLGPLVDLFAQAVKWLLIIGAIVTVVLIGMFGGPVLIILFAVASAFLFLIGIIMGVIYVVKLIWGWLGAVVKAFDDLWRTITGKTGDIKKAFISVKNELLNMMANASTWLITAGKNIIQGLIDGIKSKVGDVAGAMGGIMGVISSFVPHSPAKRGPLSGSGSPFKAGQTISAMLAGGIVDQVGAVTSASNMMVSAVQQSASTGFETFTAMGAGVGIPVQVNGQEAPTKIINNDITVNTQEIDPRKTAAELGWELSGRM